ncbi:MAG TPA: glycosyltransferase family 1 protein [Candidatus Sulfotelmatobacter sp.]|jgi:glycosyltransferase involved in cell wall biosynthesis|nr:glycosyltransferase family 1 protein [Candidatus Sulfotelmatobacter sp.]
MPSVKIGIDIRRMTEFGVGTYIRNIVRTLGRLDHENEYLLIGPAAKVEEIGALPPNFQTVAMSAPERSVQGYREFRTALQRLNCDLVHIPNLFSIPRALPCRYVMTVHDLLEHMSRAREQNGFWRSLHFQLTKRVLRGAARIFAVSNFTRNEIEKLFEIPSERIEVVYNAIDERFLRGHATAADRELIAKRYQVTYPFLLYAGRISSHKNVVRMIEAFSALKTELERDQAYPDLKLIIIGDDLSGNPDLRRTVVRSDVQNDVRFLGFVPIEVLRIFYDEAKIFVFPSLYEGFGLPPLEAMAHGTPVVTSNVSSLPEVVGNAAVLVNPENVFEIMRALHKVLMDQALRDRMKERGYVQAAKFSWDKSVTRILQAYRQVAGVETDRPDRQPAAD